MQQAVREMIVYGMVYKRGHKRKNWQMRLFVLDGASCKYFELGNTAAPKGSIELAQVRARDMKCIACCAFRRPCILPRVVQHHLATVFMLNRLPRRRRMSTSPRKESSRSLQVLTSRYACPSLLLGRFSAL